jgi:hypothetical protein
LDHEPRDVVFCDGKGKIVPLSYDVQAAVIELFGEVRNATTLRDEIRTLRGECQRLRGALDEVKSQSAQSAWKMPVGYIVNINRVLRKQFGMGEGTR